MNTGIIATGPAQSFRTWVSDEIERIDSFLNNPECDLHGDPIPPTDGPLPH